MTGRHYSQHWRLEMTYGTQAHRILDTAVSGRLSLTWLGHGRTQWSVVADETFVILDLVKKRLLALLPSETEAEFPRTCRYVPTEEGYKLWRDLAACVPARRARS